MTLAKASFVTPAALPLRDERAALSVPSGWSFGARNGHHRRPSAVAQGQDADAESVMISFCGRDGRLGRLPAFAAVIPLLAGLAIAASPIEPLASFSTENDAQEHCPGGLVVWLDVPTKVDYYRGQQKYGAAPGGAYVCRDEGKGVGMRATRSNQ